MNAREFRPNPLNAPSSRIEPSDLPRESGLLIALLSEGGRRVIRLGDNEGVLYTVDITARHVDVFADERLAYERDGLLVPGDERIPLNRRSSKSI